MEVSTFRETLSRQTEFIRKHDRHFDWRNRRTWSQSQPQRIPSFASWHCKETQEWRRQATH
jgi:hypothetical protein